MHVDDAIGMQDARSAVHKCILERYLGKMRLVVLSRSSVAVQEKVPCRLVTYFEGAAIDKGKRKTSLRTERSSRCVGSKPRCVRRVIQPLKRQAYC